MPRHIFVFVLSPTAPKGLLGEDKVWHQFTRLRRHIRRGVLTLLFWTTALRQSKALRTFRNDVFLAPSIGPAAAWSLVAFAFLLYEIVERYAVPEGTPIDAIDRQQSIAVVFIVGAAALIAALVSASRHRLKDFPFPRHIYARFPLKALRFVVGTLWSSASLALSFLDYVFVRVLAAPLVAPGRSRTIAFGILSLGMLCGVFLPPPFGLIAAAAVGTAIFAIVRRWSWVEAEKDRFLVERTKSKELGSRGAMLDEDLRDEALASLLLLIILIPILLRQIQWAYCGFGTEHSCPLPVKPLGSMPLHYELLEWLAYFGSHLTKAVPFVDWSEVFGVKSDWPDPTSKEGKIIVFVLRAGLDLLFLATLLQALQIMWRLVTERRAFESNQLPILEPLAENREMERIALALNNSFGLPVVDLPAVRTAYRYDADRLMEIVQSVEHRDSEEDDDSEKYRRFLRGKVAVALLGAQHPDGDTAEFFTAQSGSAKNVKLRKWVVDVASRLPPRNSEGEANRKTLQDILQDVGRDPRERAAAARALGRLDKCEATKALLLEKLTYWREFPEVRAGAAVALANQGVTEADQKIARLAGRVPHPQKGNFDGYVPILAVAYALPRPSNPLDFFKWGSKSDDRRLAVLINHAARIQRIPLSTAAAQAQLGQGQEHDQLVRIEPKPSGEFPPGFWMGSPDDEERSLPSERPRHFVTMKQSFAIGRYPVTVEEYLAFLNATRNELPTRFKEYQLRNAGGDTTQTTAVREDPARLPIVDVSWIDAMHYCGWLERVTGRVYRLPTEAEWEYACRAGKDGEDDWYNTGKDIGAGQANYSGSLGKREVREKKIPITKRVPVHMYDPNNFGLYHMHGNVFEWCADPWHKTFDDKPGMANSACDQSAWVEGGSFELGVMRGGSWYSFRPDLRAARRLRYSSTNRIDYGGFRLAMTLPDHF
ncbi:SUMF1/EgtB/PvdO family nonheme iron enzyme [Hyphomicrobium sp. xq]|uniref:SUMF1/EgtB/PvdO family nonheme iron enzyme n=1 Tax=Hyphomicrobium album TaxID=2665159 RepID=A0A6I3KKU8_9HYPH|nr:SUMF1/EgtB/PvdO family nonheme iron enzyme [Hyphomicrobium album]MTD94372.1 SUMF1/EgtB/PvdO family nonheme iron enzyme [Hyphomicrobium album]